MKRLMALVMGIAIVMAVGGVAYAQGPGFGQRMGMGPGGGGGWMGGGGCPGWAAAQGGAPATEPVTEEKAKELATTYADKYFKGFTVERVLPFQGRWATAYRVELKGPKGEARVLHVNPWGQVRPFGPVAAAGY